MMPKTTRQPSPSTNIPAELYLMCDSIEAVRSSLADKGVESSDPIDAGWGILTSDDDRTPSGPSLDIFAVEVGTDREIPIAANDGFDETGPAISPDGRWIAHTSNEAGAPQTYVRPDG